MEAPRLLIISGWGFPPATWHETVRTLQPAYDCRVVDAGDLIRIDPSAGSAGGVADALRRQLDPIRPCYLCGWSLGGMLALQCARDLADEIRGLLLIAATPQFCRGKAQTWGISPAKVRAMRSGLGQRPETILESFYREVASPFESSSHRYGGNMAEVLGNLEGLKHGLNYMLAANLRRRALNAGLPVMMLHGRDDRIVPHTGSRSLTFQLQPSRLDLIDKAGHDLPLRRPDLVAQAADRLQALCL
jgi:pimeloyl-[acyl-carrier protein] methyl ester esterase